MIDTGLRGRVVLVTGATRSTGRVAARLFAAEGAWIAVNYRTDVHRAKSLVDTIRCDGGRALLVPGDVGTPEGAWTVARYVEHEWAQIDVLLHTAALLSPDEAVADATPLLAEVVPGMRERGWGRVVIFSLASAAAPRHDLWEASAVLANMILLPGGDRLARLDEAAARVALFLGSEWNMCLTGATLDVAGTMVAQEIP